MHDKTTAVQTEGLLLLCLKDGKGVKSFVCRRNEEYLKCCSRL